MSKLSILLAIMLSLPVAALAEDDGIVRIRSDGLMIDASGKIIAVPDVKNPNNTEYEKYYKSVGADGLAVGKSDFYITAKQYGGYEKNPIGGKPAATTSAPSSQSQPQQNGMVRKYDGNQVLEKRPGAPIYDSQEIRSVY